MRNRERGISAFVGNAALNLAALGGLICLVLVVLAFAFNVTLIMFKTGSMGPTIPAGSLAVVREIPAAEIQVGDVVTVDRPAVLPITHRVTSVVAGSSGGERVITMKGDGNKADDPIPYTVSTVRIVVGSVPGLAHVVIWFSNPWVLGALTLGASALVTWAFWPRSPRDRGGADDGPEDHSDAEGVPPTPGPDGRHRPTVSAFLVAPVLLAVGLSLAVGTPSFAAWRAAITEQVIAGEHLTLTSIGDLPAMANLAPGEPVQWQVGVSDPSGEPGEVQISLSGTGSAELGLYAAINSCGQRWVNGNCATGATVLQASSLVAVDGVERPLEATSTEQQRWLLFDLVRAADVPEPATGATVSLQVRALGSGDDLSVSPGPLGALPHTGVDPLMPVLAAAGVILLGLAIAGAARMRRVGSR